MRSASSAFGLALLAAVSLLPGRARAAEAEPAELEKELATAKAEIEQLRKALAQKEREIVELQHRLVARQEDLTNAATQLERLKDELRGAKQLLKTIINTTGSKADAERKSVKAMPQPRMPEMAIRANVRSVHKQVGLVVLDGGQDHGLEKGHWLEVLRDGKRVGRIVVDEVFPDMSAAHWDVRGAPCTVEVGDVAATPREDTPKTGAEAMTRIVALGDSTTNCVKKAGVTEETAWRSLLAADLAKRLKRPVEVVNAGVDADTAPLALKRLERDVLDRKPGLVVIMLGTNDAGFFRPPNGVADTPRVAIEEFEKAMREIVQQVRKAGAGVVLATSVPMSGHYGLRNLPAYKQNGLNYLVKQYAEVTRRLAKELGLPLAEVHEAFEKHPERDALIPDGIHPNAAGQRLIADTLLPVLERQLRPR